MAININPTKMPTYLLCISMMLGLSIVDRTSSSRESTMTRAWGGGNNLPLPPTTSSSSSDRCRRRPSASGSALTMASAFSPVVVSIAHRSYPRRRRRRRQMDDDDAPIGRLFSLLKPAAVPLMDSGEFVVVMRPTPNARHQWTIHFSYSSPVIDEVS